MTFGQAFLKRFTLLLRIFDQTFFEKVCGQAFLKRFTLLLRIFDQTFFEKVCVNSCASLSRRR